MISTSRLCNAESRVKLLVGPGTLGTRLAMAKRTYGPQAAAYRRFEANPTASAWLDVKLDHALRWFGSDTRLGPVRHAVWVYAIAAWPLDPQGASGRLELPTLTGPLKLGRRRWPRDWMAACDVAQAHGNGVYLAIKGDHKQLIMVNGDDIKARGFGQEWKHVGRD